jgi:hypothetical protein
MSFAGASSAVCGLHVVELAAGGAAAFLLLSLSGCGTAFEDNATHLAYALEKGSQQLRASSDSDLVVHYETLDSLSQPPSIAAGRRALGYTRLGQLEATVPWWRV